MIQSRLCALSWTCLAVHAVCVCVCVRASKKHLDTESVTTIGYSSQAFSSKCGFAVLHGGWTVLSPSRSGRFSFPFRRQPARMSPKIISGGIQCPASCGSITRFHRQQSQPPSNYLSQSATQWHRCALEQL